MTLMQFIANIRSAVVSSNGPRLSELLDIGKPASEQMIEQTYLSLVKMNGGADRVILPELNELATSKKNGSRAERFSELIMTYLEFVDALRNEYNFQKASVFAMSLISIFAKISENEEFWIMFPLMSVTDKVRKFVVTNYDYIKESDSPLGAQESEFNSNTVTPYDEKLVAVLQRPFKLCLSDKSDTVISKKILVYYFATQLFKVYFRFNKFEAANNLFKVLQSAPNLPQLDQVLTSHRVNYRYFSGVICCMKDDLVSANEYFTYALNQCDQSCLKQQEKILLILLPIKFLINRKLPSGTLWKQFPRLKLSFKPLFDALKVGDLHSFETHFQNVTKLLLTKQIYSIYLRFKPFIFLKLLRTVFTLENITNNQMKLQIMQLAWKLSTHRKDEISLDEIESQIAYLISKGYIKGYISHGNRVLVLSKTAPFPRLT